MTLQDAMKIANSSINGFGSVYEEGSFTIDEAIKALTRDVKNCWHVWITGENALEILVSHRDSELA